LTVAHSSSTLGAASGGAINKTAATAIAHP
jgi:hypothetical protein